MRSWFARIVLVAALTPLPSALAGGPNPSDASVEARALPRRSIWPYGTGPRYGTVPDSRLLEPRVIRLAVGSFATDGAGLALPAALRLDDESARRPTAPWIVQLQGPITEAAKQQLRAHGVTLFDYVPNNAFVVRAADPLLLSRLPGVLWAAPFHPGYRLAPEIGTAPTADPEIAKNERLSARVLLFDSAERNAAIAALSQLGAEIDFATTFESHEYTDRIYFFAAPEMLWKAARLDAVRYVEEAPRTALTLNAESKVVMQSGFVSAGTPIWDAGINGSSQKAGVMDNGMDPDTILLSNTATDAGTPGSSHRKILAYTPYGGGDTKSCGNYTHGTNTTQCAIGNRTDFGQNGDLEGVAKAAKVFFQDIGPGNSLACAFGSLSPPASLVSLYDQVRNGGGHLTNGSFSGGSGYCANANDADQYMWDHKDFLMMFSAGNGGGVVCPGDAKNVVGAGGYFQDPFYNEPYGSVGPAPGNRICPTVMAPACDHPGGNAAPFNYDTSTSIQSNDQDLVGVPETNVSQGACGTSFSSPYTMGAGLLIRDFFEKGFYPSGSAKPSDALSPSGALVKAVLLNSGEFMNCASCGSFGSNTQGMGRVNLTRTLSIAGDPRTVMGLHIVDKGASNGLATGGRFDDTIDVSDATKPLRVTLNWTDRPGQSLVNNLRLTVIGPGGGPARTYFGNNFSGEFSLSQAAGGTADDGLNPFESVFIKPAELITGTWSIRVDGTSVPNGDANFGNTQPFALVVSGGFSSTGVREVSPPGAAQPLRVTSAAGSTVNWSWEAISDPNARYSFYRGDLGPLAASGTYSHKMIDAAHCGLTANSTSVTDRQDGANSYYLVAEKKGTTEGSLGKRSNGQERPPASPACP